MQDIILSLVIYEVKGRIPLSATAHSSLLFLEFRYNFELYTASLKERGRILHVISPQRNEPDIPENVKVIKRHCLISAAVVF